MEGKRFIRTLEMQNLLSFGNDGTKIELQPLNVLIGPNASGKSNVLEALELLRATPGDLTLPIREGGGIADWLWKGADKTPVANIAVTVEYPFGKTPDIPLRYSLSFTMVGQRTELVDEAVENERRSKLGERDVLFFYRYQQGRPVLNIVADTGDGPGLTVGRTERHLRREDLSPDQSVLSQRKDPDLYPELTYLGRQFANVHLYREWSLGRYTEPRRPQQADLPGDFLLENASNLALVVNSLQHGSANELLVENLRKFYPEAENLSTRVSGGTVQLFVHEKGLRSPIAATRLSDGTLRYLCLLTMLCHPEPPPLICIEEPELGLHPDILPTVAELMIDASQRTQLIVTTHSEALVSALSDVPEAVLVCEHREPGTELRRLDPENLKEWLEHYSLGDLWRMGEIGGTRW